ncbi:hypothetical protein [Coleofasciculus sp. G2-EDA-02]|uniref:hypothetical protein n=1 Tax=Coleofasciculus sp. G2-EDA-02 TaxID=3069529 RepID=UPI0032F89AD6
MQHSSLPENEARSRFFQFESRHLVYSPDEGDEPCWNFPHTLHTTPLHSVFFLAFLRILRQQATSPEAPG